MASKVNTKFVVMLVGALLALAIGVGALAAYSLRMSGERNIAAGDALMLQAEQARAAGDEAQALEYIDEASGQYGRAVHKDRSRRDWLVKLRDTLLQTNPDSEVEYRKRYEQTYLGVLEQLASLDPTNGYAQYEFISAREEWLRLIGGASALLAIENETARRLQSLRAESPMAIRLNGILGLARIDRAELESVDLDKREEAVALMQRFYEEYLADPQQFTAAPPDHAAPEAFAEAAREDHRRVALGLIRANIVEYQVAVNEGRSQDAREHLVNAGSTGERILAENSEYQNDPRFWLQMIRASVGLVALDEPNPVRRKANIEQKLVEARDQVFASLAASDAKEMPLEEVAKFWEWYSDAASRSEISREVDRVLGHSGVSPIRHYLVGLLLAEMDRKEEAIEIFKRVETSPVPALSADGVLLPLRQSAAMARQVDIYLELRERSLLAGNADEAKMRLDAAIETRNRLAANTGLANRPNVLLADAKIAIARNEPRQAIRLLEEYRKEFTETIEVQIMLAQMLLAVGNSGEARQILEPLAAQGMLNETGVGTLADLYRRNGELDRAVEMLRNQARRSTNPEAYTALIAEYQQLLDIQAGNESTDPVLAAAIRADELIARRDLVGATQALDRLVSRQPDASADSRVEILRARIHVLRGEKEQAIGRLERALESNPNDQLLRNYLDRLKAENPADLLLSQIDASDASEIAKSLRRYDVLRAADRGDEAEAELARLEQLDPTHPTVIETRFAQALAQEDFAEAERIAARAEDANVDGVDGLLYQGRLQGARGDLVASVRTLRTAVELVPSSIDIRRHLGLALLESGQVDEGIDFLRRAYEANQGDWSVLIEYVQALRQLGRVNEARAVLDPRDRPSAPARQNRGITNLWLSLESQAGNIATALNERRNYFRADQMSGLLEEESFAQVNAANLLELLLAQGNTEEAEQILEQVRSVLEERQIALVEAGVAVARARGLEDRQQSQQAIDAAIIDLRNFVEEVAASENSADALFAGAQFAFNNGNFEQGIEMLRTGVQYEDAETRPVSRAIAQRQANRATQLDARADQLEAQAEQLVSADPQAAEALREQAAQDKGLARASREEAASVYEQMIAAGVADADVSIALAQAELLLQTDQVDRAAEIVAGVRNENPNSLEAILLAAQIAMRNGNRVEAARLFDQAVERNRTDFRSFYRRAQFHIQDSSRRADVLADLRRVNELRSSFSDAWVLRYRVMLQAGDVDAALTVLRDGINAAPSIAEPLSRVLAQQLINLGRRAEALNFASQQVVDNPESAYWLSTAGQLAQQLDSMNEAVRFFGMLLESPEVVSDPLQQGLAASYLLNARLLAEQPVSMAEINSLMPLIETLGFEGTGGIYRKMLLARAFFTIPAERGSVGSYIQQAYEEAIRESEEATTTEKLRVWFANFELLAGSSRQAYDYVIDAERAFRSRMDQNPDLSIPLYLEVLVLQGLRSRVDSYSDLIARAESLLPKSDNDRIARYEINRLLSTFYRLEGDYTSSVEYAKAALTIVENDLELINNVAFFLAKYLDRAPEALPYAERAAELAPENAVVLDTVGVVYMLNGEVGRAISTLELALRFATTQEQRLPATVHLAEALFRQGDIAAARTNLEDAERLLPLVSEGLRAEYGPDVERVTGLLETR